MALFYKVLQKYANMSQDSVQLCSHQSQTFSTRIFQELLVFSQQFDDLEPTLTRHGYHLTDLVQQFDAKPTEIKALYNNQLDPARTAALRDRMLRAGLPL